MLAIIGAALGWLALLFLSLVGLAALAWFIAVGAARLRHRDAPPEGNGGNRENEEDGE